MLLCCRPDPGAERQLQAPEDQPQAPGHRAAAAARQDPRRLHPPPVRHRRHEAPRHGQHHRPRGESVGFVLRGRACSLFSSW